MTEAKKMRDVDELLEACQIATAAIDHDTWTQLTVQHPQLGVLDVFISDARYLIATGLTR